jgi:hypothetical protein
MFRNLCLGRSLWRKQFAEKRDDIAKNSKERKVIPVTGREGL